MKQLQWRRANGERVVRLAIVSILFSQTLIKHNRFVSLLRTAGAKSTDMDFDFHRSSPNKNPRPALNLHIAHVPPYRLHEVLKDISGLPFADDLSVSITCSSDQLPSPPGSANSQN